MLRVIGGCRLLCPCLSAPDEREQAPYVGPAAGLAGHRIARFDAAGRKRPTLRAPAVVDGVRGTRLTRRKVRIPAGEVQDTPERVFLEALAQYSKEEINFTRIHEFLDERRACRRDKDLAEATRQLLVAAREIYPKLRLPPPGAGFLAAIGAVGKQLLAHVGDASVPFDEFRQAALQGAGTCLRLGRSASRRLGVRALEQGSLARLSPLADLVSSVAARLAFNKAVVQACGYSVDMLERLSKQSLDLCEVTSENVFAIHSAIMAQQERERVNRGLSLRDILVLDSALLYVDEMMAGDDGRLGFDLVWHGRDLRVVKGSRFSAHYLPWKRNDITWIDLPLRPGERDPAYFLTAHLNGCSIGVQGGEECIRVFHRDGPASSPKEIALTRPGARVAWLHPVIGDFRRHKPASSPKEIALTADGDAEYFYDETYYGIVFGVFEAAPGENTKSWHFYWQHGMNRTIHELAYTA